MDHTNSIRLRQTRAILVVPPFADLDRPSLGVHLLQAAARQIGFDVQILYANILFAAHFGEETCTQLKMFRLVASLCERLFHRAAFGGPALGRDGGEALIDLLTPVGVSPAELRRLEADIPAWLDSFVPDIAAGAYPVAGCSTSFEQNCASLAILGKLKRRCPGILTILGGANCAGEMAEGVCSLSDDIDYVFSGESEQTFADFLTALGRGERPAARIIRGEPCMDMDALPTPDFSDYYEQMRLWAPQSPSRAQMFLNYETSRGCWWAQKKGCTFCGLNGPGKQMRSKTPDRIIEELTALLARHPTNQVCMTDNIMPCSYFRDLLPRLANELPGASIFYQQRANLSLSDVELLVRAGVTQVQAGIEALSTGLLRLMRKGTDAAQNIALLRYARSTGLIVHWSMLFGFPGDELSHYSETLELLPLLAHLRPPTNVCGVLIDRFSQYFDHPEKYGISDFKPYRQYSNVYPEHADLDKLAQFFEAKFATALIRFPDIERSLKEAVYNWKCLFYSASPPELRVIRNGGAYLMIDSRGLQGIPSEQKIDEKQAAMALVTRPVGEQDGTDYEWAIDNQVVVERDHRYIALAVAEPALIHEVEACQEHGTGNPSATQEDEWCAR